MPRALLFILVLTVFPRPAFAVEVVWMELQAGFGYRDETTACEVQSSFGNDVRLVLELEGDVAVRGRLKRGAVLFPMKDLTLKPEELGAITLQRDPSGNAWLRRAELSERMVIWLVHQLAGLICPLPQALKTVTAAPIPFDFEGKGLGVDSVVNPSREVRFQGTRKDGKPYRALLKLVQRQYL